MATTSSANTRMQVLRDPAVSAGSRQNPPLDAECRPRRDRVICRRLPRRLRDSLSRPIVAVPSDRRAAVRDPSRLWRDWREWERPVCVSEQAGAPVSRRGSRSGPPRCTRARSLPTGPRSAAGYAAGATDLATVWGRPLRRMCQTRYRRLAATWTIGLQHAARLPDPLFSGAARRDSEGRGRPSRTYARRGNVQDRVLFPGISERDWSRSEGGPFTHGGYRFTGSEVPQ